MVFFQTSESCLRYDPVVSKRWRSITQAKNKSQRVPETAGHKTQNELINLMSDVVRKCRLQKFSNVNIVLQVSVFSGAEDALLWAKCYRINKQIKPSVWSTSKYE